MLISTRLKIAALVSALIVLAITAGVLVSYRAIARLEDQKRSAFRISEAFNELNSLVRAYALYHGERPKRQFLLNHDAATKLIASVSFEEPGHRRLLQETARRSEMVKSLFLKLVSNYERMVSKEGDSLLQQSEERLVGQILIRSRDAIAHASRLVRLIDEEIAARQKRIATLVLALIVAAAVLLTVILLSVMRSITTAFFRLRRGTEIVGAGNLTHRIGIESDDEIGHLSQAFDAMTGQLQSTTVSRDKLAVEVADRKSAEEALRRSQSLLSEAERLSHAGAWEWDLAGDRWTCSDEWMRIHGCLKRFLSPEEVLPIAYPDDRPAVERVLEDLRKGAKPCNLEHRIIRQNTGEVRVVRIHGRIERDSNGAPVKIIGVAQDITEQKQVEEQLKHLNETLEQRVYDRTAEVRQLADQLRALAADLSQTEQRERKRLAKLLHDHIQQLLVAARMCVELIRPVSRSEQVKSVIKELDGILREAIDASRTLTIELSPPVLSQAGLIAALNWLSDMMAEKYNFKVNVRSDNHAEPAAEEVRFLLFECVRELLFNALKHSGGKEADVAAERTHDARIKITVEDEGRGFDPIQLRPSGRGAATFGLFSIQERLAHIGGSAVIETAPGKGTRVTLSVPASGEKPTVDASAGGAAC